jgi:hypothetical protein
MPQIMGTTYHRACANAYEEFRKAQDAVGAAVAAFQPYKVQFADETAIYDAFPKAMEDARRIAGPGGQPMFETAENHAKALVAWEAWKHAESILQQKRDALNSALTTLVSQTSGCQPTG